MIVKFLPKQHDSPEVILRRFSKDFQIVFDCLVNGNEFILKDWMIYHRLV